MPSENDYINVCLRGKNNIKNKLPSRQNNIIPRNKLLSERDNTNPRNKLLSGQDNGIPRNKLFSELDNGIPRIDFLRGMKIIM
jgi:hypothetical protein